MPGANELQGFSKFLRDTLIADEGVQELVGSRVFEDVAPQGTAYPFVIFSLNRALVLNAQGNESRIHTRPAYVVRATVQGESYAAADAIAVAIDGALEGAKGTAAVGGVPYQVRGVFQTTPVRYPTGKDGVHYRHAGGIYETFIHV